MHGFTMIDLAIVIIYLSAVLFAGLYFSKNKLKGKQYFKGDGGHGAKRRYLPE